MTVVRKCDSPHAYLKSMEKLCQLMERYDGHGEEV